MTLTDQSYLDEFSVVFTERSVNHMSVPFQKTMRGIHSNLCQVYGAEACVLIPGGGTFSMEAVARQFGTAASVFVVRNGLFSYRWSQIFEAAQIARSVDVFTARQVEDAPTAPFAPAPIEDVTQAIAVQRPQVIFAPHVETSAGMRLPDDYIRKLSAAARDVDALLVIDCIASGAHWLDMADLGIDVLISAPQKGWSSSPSCGIAMLGQRALDRLDQSQSQSFSVDLKKWHQIMQAYTSGGHAYHATMPTDALIGFSTAIDETMAYGLQRTKQAQEDLGFEIRNLLTTSGYASVAAPGFHASGVVVAFTEDPEMSNGKRFASLGMQIAAGVPLFCGERQDYRSFRIGLFGLDKWKDVSGTVARFKEVLSQL